MFDLYIENVKTFFEQDGRQGGGNKKNSKKQRMQKRMCVIESVCFERVCVMFLFGRDRGCVQQR